MGFDFGVVVFSPSCSCFSEGNGVLWFSSITLQCLTSYYCETHTWSPWKSKLVKDMENHA